MKVEEVFNEAGLPTEQHKATLMRAVEAEMQTFNTATNELITGEWTQFLTETDDMGDQIGGITVDAEACFNEAEAAYVATYEMSS